MAHGGIDSSLVPVPSEPGGALDRESGPVTPSQLPINNFLSCLSPVFSICAVDSVGMNLRATWAVFRCPPCTFLPHPCLPGHYFMGLGKA